MKRQILLPIHPKFADLIVSGEKTYEYRKILPLEEISHIVLYSTSPIQRMVAIVEVVEEISDTPLKLWEKTSKEGAISLHYFEQYFSGKKYARAYKLGKVSPLVPPIALDRLCVSSPPQSFRYLSANEFNIISPA
ncbi:MAG: ASCH domain-containing protein [Planctomycetota bacterium]|jgi:predicted transcriptional regulator|nr:ASCH domain-containing protein [Planctomycetota bacterium]